MNGKSLIIVFEDKFLKEHLITYKTFESNLAKKWIKVIAENQKDRNKYLHTTLYNVTTKDIPEIHLELNELTEKINQEYDEPLPVYSVDKKLTSSELNLLHSMFERWGDRIPENEAAGKHTREISEKFLRLNELIHTYENALDSNRQSFPTMYATVDYYPQTIFRNLEPIDKLSLTNCYDWGQLYLGYNTLGKDWLTVATNNDIDLIKRGSVRPQKRFAAEAWISFHKANRHPLVTPILFEKWFNSLDDDLKLAVPIDNMSELVLGKFLIGEVAINDYFLQFDSKRSNWLIPNSETKKRWNLEVFSTFRKIKEIRLL